MAEMVETKPAIAIGDYVLATKYRDGDPGDHWALGFYDGEREDRHFVIDSEGKQLRHNGFRRVGRVDPELGRWLLTNAKMLESCPPGAVNLWGMIDTERNRLEIGLTE